MGDVFERDEALYLPSEFLTFEDILKEHNFKKQSNTTEFNFPSEFPFDFDQNVTPTTRQPHPFPSYKNYMKNRFGLAGSPPPTAVVHFGSRHVSGGGGSRNFPAPPISPPLGPAGKSWAAAELVRNSSAFNNDFVQRVREEQLLKQHLERCVWVNNHGQNWNVEKQSRVGRSAIGAYGEKEQVAWRFLQSIRQQTQENRTISRGDFVNAGSGNQFSGEVKKQRSGTGVFLPRSYGTNNQNDIKKSSCLTTPILDKGGPGHYSKGSFNVMGSGVVKHPGQTRISDEFDSDYDLQLAKMKLVLLQRREHMRHGRIPQGGTY